jgi:Uma2 family endonuclease
MATPKYHGMTYDEYCLLPDDGNRYQVLEGELFVSPAPRPHHQRVLFHLALLLHDYVLEHRLGEIFIAPIDVILEPTTIVQPDIVFIGSDKAEIVTDLNIQGPPDLCIEVVSPTTGLIDRHAKRNIYARFGVREYWIVDPNRQTVNVYTLRDRAYGEAIEMTGDALIRSVVIEGFTIRAGDIFAM